jgi:hypothetical protein
MKRLSLIIIIMFWHYTLEAQLYATDLHVSTKTEDCINLENKKEITGLLIEANEMLYRNDLFEINHSGQLKTIKYDLTGKQRLDSVIIKGTDSSEKYYHYDIQGRIVKYSVIKNNDRSDYFFDYQGLDTTQFVSQRKNGEWQIITKYTSHYDQNRNRTSWMKLDNVSGIILEYESVNYNLSGQITLRERYKWSSTIEDYIGVNRVENEWDNNGNNILNIEYKWNIAKKEWLVRFKKKLNSSGQQVEYESYHIDVDGNLISGEDKYEFAYNEKGVPILYKSYNWNSVEKNWILSVIHNYRIDGSGSNYIYSKAEYDSIMKKMVYEKYKCEFIFKDSNVISEIIEYKKDYPDTNYVFFTKTNVEHNSNNELIQMNYYNWDKQLNNWVNHKKYEYNWDSNGRQILYIENEWNNSRNKWMGVLKRIRNWNESGDLVLETEFRWDDDNWYCSYFFQKVIEPGIKNLATHFFNGDSNMQNWESGYKGEIIFNEKLDTIKVEDYRLEISNQTWILISGKEIDYDDNNNKITETRYLENNDKLRLNSRKFDFYYEDNVSIEEVLIPQIKNLFFSEIYFTHSHSKLCGWDEFIWKVDKWSFDKSVMLYYSNVEINSVSEPKFNAIPNIYPNPTKGLISISGIPNNELSKVIIFNLLGRKVFETTIHDTENIIDLSYLNKGVYVLQIGKNQSERIKIIKE